MAIISKASGVNDTIFGKSQYPIKSHIEKTVEAWEEKQQIPNIFKEDKTTNFAESYDYETAGLDMIPTGENGTYPDDNDFQGGYQTIVIPYTFKDRYTVTMEMIEDAKIGKIKTGVGAKTANYYRTREKFGASVLTNGQATSMSFGRGSHAKTFDLTLGDGKALFATDHPSKTGNTGDQSNLYVNELTYDNIGLVETAMQNYTDDNGNILALDPDSIIIPNVNAAKQSVFEILNADGKPTTADRAGNYHFGRWNVLVYKYLSNPSNLTAGKFWWMMMDSEYNKNYGGLIWLQRIDLMIRSFIDDNNDANVWNYRTRFMAKGNDWRAISACIPGSGGTTLS